MMNFKKYKFVFWALGIAAVLFIAYLLFQMTQSSSINSVMTLLMLVLGLVLGGVIAFLASKKMASSAPVITDADAEFHF